MIASESRTTDADVVAIGTVVRRGLGGVFIGNAAEDAFNGLEGPVHAVKPQGFVSSLDRQ